MPPTLIKDAYEETKSSIPLVIILSQGADPNADMRAFAQEHDYVDRLEIVSLGQGQDKRARKLID